MKKYTLLLTTIITLILTVLFSTMPLNWLSQADVSNMFPTYITPAWYTFSIWMIIYISWITLSLYIIIKKPKDITKKEINFLAAAIFISAIWLIPYHYLVICITLSLIVLILGLLYFLIKYPSLNKLFNIVNEIYFWWIYAATLLNIHLLLVFRDFYEYWVILWVVSILVWVLLNIYLLRKYSTYIASLILVWALFWIIVKQMNEMILNSSIIWIFLILLAIVFNIYNNKQEYCKK